MGWGIIFASCGAVLHAGCIAWCARHDWDAPPWPLIAAALVASAAWVAASQV
jgi:hypothetical protein